METNHEKSNNYHHHHHTTIVLHAFVDKSPDAPVDPKEVWLLMASCVFWFTCGKDLRVVVSSASENNFSTYRTP